MHCRAAVQWSEFPELNSQKLAIFSGQLHIEDVLNCNMELQFQILSKLGHIL